MAYQDLAPQEVADFLQLPDCIVLDMRDRQSYDSGHLEGALAAHNPTVGSLIRGKKFDAPILVYCYHGISSRDLATLLSKLGFRDVYNLEGGWQAWQNYLQQETELPRAVVRWLIAEGFEGHKPNSRVDNGMTPLMVAALRNDTAMAQAFIQAGAEINLRNDDGNNALWFACVAEGLELIRLLIDSGVDLDNQNVNGATCLIYAASASKLEVVKALVEAGADLGKKTHDDFTALDSAASLPVLRYLKHSQGLLQHSGSRL